MLDKRVLPPRSKRRGPPQDPPLAGSPQVSSSPHMTAAGRYSCSRTVESQNNGKVMRGRFCGGRRRHS